MQSDEYLVNNKLSVPPANYNQQGVLTFAGTSVFSYVATEKRVIFTLADRLNRLLFPVNGRAGH